MGFHNRGRIHPAAGPEGHTHSIYQLNDIAAGGYDMDTLVNSNGIWTSVNGLPYVIATGKTSVTLTSSSPWSTGAATVDLTLNPYNNPFSMTPLVVATAGTTGTTGPLVVQYNATATSITLRLNYAGSSSSAVSVSWIAIQIAPNSITGYVSKDPNV